MKKNNRNLIIIIGIAVLCLAAGILYSILSGRVAQNPAGTIGNTAGNLNNGGFFCQHEDTVYFANAYDGGTLYRMDVDETHIEKINSSKVSNLLSGVKNIYYFQSGTVGEGGLGTVRTLHSFVRCDLNGNHATGLARDVVITAQLVDNTLYLLTTSKDGPSFYRMDTDKTDKTILADYNINPACAAYGKIYYNGTQSNHFLYALDAANDTSTEIWRGNLWNPILNGSYIYYMDVANNYRLCRYSLTNQVIEVLTDDRVDCFNLGNGFIYYQKNSTTPALICMRTDGTDSFVLAEGNYTALQMTSSFLYFNEFGIDSTLYHSRLGSTSYNVFEAARATAVK